MIAEVVQLESLGPELDPRGVRKVLGVGNDPSKSLWILVEDIDRQAHDGFGGELQVRLQCLERLPGGGVNVSDQ